MNRRSYAGLMKLPAWGLYDGAGGLVATVRARSAQEARTIFKEHEGRAVPEGVGQRVKRVKES